ncbi:hypothetical protein LCGC14_1976200 [marine sediment metagenome]|uniref:HNH domain-containing protein n=1 Tax=marine sediment metagenome TaxID=412755 RepID=A0A0F9FYH8_9ZZZZ
MQIIKRKEAKDKGLKGYFTGNTCKQGHIAERQTSNGCCRSCINKANTSPEGRARSKKYRQTENGRQQRSMWEKKYFQTDQGRAASTKRTKRYFKTDRGKAVRNTHSRKNQIKRFQTQPIWVSDENIARLYLEAQRLTKETGIKRHVHHIIPLCQLDYVCGLHCEANLVNVTEDEHKRLHSSEEVLKTLW